MNEKLIRKILKEEFGIKTEKELAKAMENTQIDISCFVQPVEQKKGVA